MHLPLFLQPSILHELKNELMSCLHFGGLKLKFKKKLILESNILKNGIQKAYVMEQLHSKPKSFSLHSIKVSVGARRSL